MNPIDVISERPSALPAAAVLRVRPPFAGVDPAACPDSAAVSPDRAAIRPVSAPAPRHRAGFGGGSAAGTALHAAGLLADVKAAIQGRSASVPAGGYAAHVQQMEKQQINVGTTGVGGDPPRGRPN